MKIFKSDSKQVNLSLVFMASILLSACATVPKSIDVVNKADLINYSSVSMQVRQNPNSIIETGKKARWGGKIVSVENKKEVSEIEIVFFPENSYGKPQTGLVSLGRFKAVVDGFVDPLVFEQGRLITVVGELSRTQTGIIGEQEYVYPTLKALGYYMWKDVSDVRVELRGFAFSPFAYHHAYRSSFFNPWYDPWYLSSQRGRLRIEGRNGHSQGSTVSQPSRSQSASSSSSSSSRVSTSTRTVRSPSSTTSIEK